MHHKTLLSVNINKVATLRNSRGGDMPNVVQFALDCERYGAEGITVHPRPDERHIRYEDVRQLSKFFPNSKTEFNIEGFPIPSFIDLVIEAKPNQVTLVSDKPEALTSSEGWDTKSQYEFLKPIVDLFKKHQVRVSLFMDTDFELLDYAAKLDVERVEFYTGTFAEEYEKGILNNANKLKAAAIHAHELGLEINAGHDLSMDNLAYLKSIMPMLKEVSIGHALIKDCLYLGLENVIPMYQRLLD
jgi:pyridoxine 5-phosphate synthase